VRLLAGAAALALLTAACAPVGRAPARRTIIQRVLPATVQVRVERDDGVHRAGSGVVVATEPATRRAWIVTTRHLLDPAGPQRLTVRRPGRQETFAATVVARSTDADLALVHAEGLDVAPVVLKPMSGLGDDVFVVAFPWGRRLTVVAGIVSQLAPADDGTIPVTGSVRMVDAPASYGSSGGGVFDAASGTLLGVVEGYRTATLRPADGSRRPLELPVAGETTVIPAAAILRFLAGAGIEARIAP
jgi:S1-C subfamily serine protease